MVEDDGSEDKFPYHPSDLPDVDWYLQENFDKVLEVITTIKNAGNKFYKEKNYQKAVQKYKKSCRYIEHLRTCMGATEDSEEGTFFSFSNIIRGHSTTTWTEFCHFFPPPPCVASFYTLSVDKNRHFLTPSPPSSCPRSY